MTRVIAIEGIDGSGKSVQFQRLGETLRARGLRVEMREYPVYDTGFFGAQAGRYLTGADGVRADTVDAKSMALWFALDRWEDMQSYTAEADVLLINRYVLSNAVYQSVRDIDLGRPDVVDWVFELEYEHFHLPVADVFLFYDVETDSAGANVRKKGFRGYVGEDQDVYEKSGGIQARARAKYLACAAARADVAVIPCMRAGAMRSVEDIAAQTLAVLEARGLL